jgi:hypothetical protein
MTKLFEPTLCVPRMALEKTSAAIGVAIYHITHPGKPIVNLTLMRGKARETGLTRTLA